MLADRREFGVAPREQLVRVNLMTGVPDQPVFREIENQVQGDRQFDHSQVAGEVGGAGRNDIAQRLAHFTGELFEFAWREFLEVGGGVNP